MHHNDMSSTAFWFVYALAFIYVINQVQPGLPNLIGAAALPILPAAMARAAIRNFCRTARTDRGHRRW